MSRFLQGKITYANVVATLALVFAMSGGALAANHYLINSTKQISPKVLKKLKGATGKTGKTGLPGISIQGPTGPVGLKGEKGGQGAKGSNGTNGVSGFEPLPSGKSVSGEYAVRAVAGEATQLEEAVTFPMSITGGIDNEPEHEHVVYAPISSPAEHCTGPGHADKGYLCIYSAESVGLKAPVVMNPEQTPARSGATGEYGFLLRWEVVATKAGEAVNDVGTYTVTAGS